MKESMKLMSIFLIFGLFFSGSAGAQDLIHLTYPTQVDAPSSSTPHLFQAPSPNHHDIYSFFSEIDLDESETNHVGSISEPTIEVSSTPSPQVIHAIASSHRSRWLEYVSLLVNSPPSLS